MAAQFITMDHVAVKSQAKFIFEDFNFRWETGQQWAVTGPNGSGKSALLAAIAGKLLTIRGQTERHFSEPFYDAEILLNPYFSYHNLIQLVDIRHDFRNRSNVQEFYYQQRYNALDADKAPTVAETLAGLQAQTARPALWSLEEVRTRLGLDPLWEKSLIQLSNGESKRLRLAKALLQNPRLLLLDNVFSGLDVATRQYFDDMLQEIASSGVHLMMVCSHDEIPSVATHVLVLDDCRIYHQSEKTGFDKNLHYPSQQVVIDHQALAGLLKSREKYHFETIVHLRDATVKYGRAVILDRVSWTVKPGERWALSGPNGSGKSTLLSLLNGDHPQAYACDLTLFDQRRGTGESIWDIKRKVGFMSPELFQFFPTDITCRQVVISGFYDTLGTSTKGTPAEQDLADRWLQILGISKEADTLLSFLPAGRQRLCLLARALVKLPPLLILDEPCQGLDHEHELNFREIVNTISGSSDIAMIYVTHYQEQLPACIDHHLRLSADHSHEVIALS